MLRTKLLAGVVSMEVTDLAEAAVLVDAAASCWRWCWSCGVWEEGEVEEVWVRVGTSSRGVQLTLRGVEVTLLILLDGVSEVAEALW